MSLSSQWQTPALRVLRWVKSCFALLCFSSCGLDIQKKLKLKYSFFFLLKYVVLFLNTFFESEFSIACREKGERKKKDGKIATRVL